MSIIKAHTWKEDLLKTQNGNLQVKSTILWFYPNLVKTFFNFKISKIKISKIAKLKSMFEKSIPETS